MEKDAKWLAWAEQRFAQVAGEDRLIYLDEFKKALNVKKVSGNFRYFCSDVKALWWHSVLLLRRYAIHHKEMMNQTANFMH